MFRSAVFFSFFFGNNFYSVKKEGKIKKNKKKVLKQWSGYLDTQLDVVYVFWCFVIIIMLESIMYSLYPKMYKKSNFSLRKKQEIKIKKGQKYKSNKNFYSWMFPFFFCSVFCSFCHKQWNYSRKVYSTIGKFLRWFTYSTNFSVSFLQEEIQLCWPLCCQVCILYPCFCFFFCNTLNFSYQQEGTRQ